MLNFTVGPVLSSDAVRKIGGQQVPYFRNNEFSQIMLENEKLMKECVNADDESKALFITGSGTAAMEATVMNIFNKDDKVLIINGGGFGQRFVELCKLHEIPYEDIKLKFGNDIHTETLNKYSNKGFTAFLVNICESSSGIYYNLNLISDFCKKNNLLLVVDAISSFLANPLDMQKDNIDVMITGSQKALACPPGISITILSKNALKRVKDTECKCMYFDFKDMLKNAKRGQTPFTPAVNILLQINVRLKEIKDNGGVDSEIERINSLAVDFRERVSDLPFEIPTESLSNSLTPIFCPMGSAKNIVDKLKIDYNIWVNPNGGELEDYMFRVGHIGELTIKDNDKLINALHDLKDKGVF